MKKKFFAMILAGAMLAGTLLTGCGDSKDDDSSKASADGKLTKVTLQLKWLPSVQFMGFYTAKEKGYYKDEGIDINIVAGGPDIVSTNQVSIGAADVAVANLYGLLPFEEQGQPITVIGQVFQKGSLILVSKKSSGINSPADLKGKKIGGWLGTADYPIYALFDKYKINKDKDVTLANQGATMDSFLNGQLDVASATVYNEYLILLESGMKEEDINVINFDDEGCGMLEDTMIANKDWLKKNPELAAKFMKATMKGWSYACENPEEGAEIVWNYVDKASSNLDHQKASAKKIAEVVAPNGTEVTKLCAINDENINATATIAKKYGIIKEIPKNICDKKAWEKALKELK